MPEVRTSDREEGTRRLSSGSFMICLGSIKMDIEVQEIILELPLNH